MPTSPTPDEMLRHWDLPGTPRETPDAGLINSTWMIGDPPVGVLQRVNPIFKATIHLDIAALTQRLQSQGLVTPHLVPTRDGRLWVPEGDASWRVLSFVPGRTVHTVATPAIAAEAGALVGRFHSALHGWDHVRSAPRRDIHDTPLRMESLRQALNDADGHRLSGPARALGQAVLSDWASWQGELDLPERTCHGDLKIANLRFDAAGTTALCLLDLDTIGPMSLACELGDAWRSWCNPAGEDDPEAAYFDVGRFEASARAFLRHAPPLTDAEHESLATATERICLELAARFCADAVQNSYFREDLVRFPGAGSHNLHRARAQHHLARSARTASPACAQILAAAR